MGHSCRKLLWSTLSGHFCRTLLWVTRIGNSCGTLLRDTLLGHSYGTLLWDTLALVRHSCRTLLWVTLVEHERNFATWSATHCRSKRITRYHQSSRSPATRRVYASMLRAPQWPSKTHTSKSAKRAFRTRLPPKVKRKHPSEHTHHACQAVSRFQPLQTTPAHTPIPM